MSIVDTPKDALLLVDGDEVIWRVATALEREVQWDEHNHVLYSNAEECWDQVWTHIDNLKDRFQTDDLVMAFTSGPNFRREIDPTYKANRAGKRKPLCYSTLRVRCEEAFDTLATPGLEADDVIGILATKPTTQQKIICGQDKDFKTIPAYVWDGEALANYALDADYWHMFQTLVGDVADGYKGCPGIGEARAKKILDASSDLWVDVVLAYEKAGLAYEDALKQARLARILRWDDWSIEHQKPILWIP